MTAPNSLPLKPVTIHDVLFLWAEKTPENHFVHAGEETYSFQDTLQVSEKLAGFLTAKGICAGATMGLLLPRRPELVFSFLAASMSGYLPTPLNYLENTTVIRQVTSSLQLKVFIVDPTVVDQETLCFLEERVVQDNILVIAVGREKGGRGFISWEESIEHALSVDLPKIKMDDIAYFNLTTGTSGFPKAAICSHANLYWNTCSAVETFNLDEEDVHLCMFASFAHPHELFCRALYTGGSLVLLTDISPRAIIGTINRYQVTCMMGLAVMYKMMAEYVFKKKIKEKKISCPGLRIAESGGMFTSPEIHESFTAAFAIPILSVWGSTETSGVAIANTPENYRRDGSMGRECLHYRVRLLDEQGRDVEQGEVGELFFSGPANVSGYKKFGYKKNGLPPVLLPGFDGWYASGDLAIQDQDGFYFFIERKSGMIKVAGLKVYPLQVELVLQEHAQVSEVAVIGVSEGRRGAVPKAFVVAGEGERIDLEELKDFARRKLARYMVPRQWQLVDSLPKIGSGKINKKVLGRE